MADEVHQRPSARRGDHVEAVPRRQPGARLDRRDRHLGPQPRARAAAAGADRPAGARTSRPAPPSRWCAFRCCSSGPDAVDPDEAMPKLFDEGTPRANRACTCTGRCPTRCCAASSPSCPTAPPNRLGLPQLPDRWVVLRVRDGDRTHPASRARLGARGRPGGRRAARRLVARIGGVDRRRATGVALAAGELTGTVGGSAVWAGVYDAVGNRFAFHDPLDDLAAGRAQRRRRRRRRLPRRRLVPGPGEATRSTAPAAPTASPSCSTPCAGGCCPTGATPATSRSTTSRSTPSAVRSASRSTAASTAAAPRSGDGAPRRPRPAAGSSRPSTTCSPATSTIGRLVDVRRPRRSLQYLTTPWHLRASLLHGAVYGVPVSAPPRPSTAGRRADAVRWRSASTTATCSPPSPACPAPRRTGAATPSGCSMRSPPSGSIGIGTPDGTVEIDEFEHARAFTSLPARQRRHRPLPPDAPSPAAPAATCSARASATRSALPAPAGSWPDRPGAPTRAARPATRRPAARTTLAAEIATHSRSTTSWSTGRRPARPPVAAPPDHAAAHRGPRRRPAGDPPHVPRTTRWSPCRAPGAACATPTTGGRRPTASSPAAGPPRWCAEDQGVISGADADHARSATARSRPRCTSLAREVALHDPYHTAWLAAAAAPKLGASTPTAIGGDRAAPARRGGDPLRRRRRPTTARPPCSPRSARRSRRPRRRAPGGAAQPMTQPSITATQIADEVHSFSLVKGADPDPVGRDAAGRSRGCRCGSSGRSSSRARQPGDRRLDARQRRPRGERLDVPRAPRPRARSRAGALLTTGAATTLKSAVDDWLTAENARDAGRPAGGPGRRGDRGGARRARRRRRPRPTS